MHRTLISQYLIGWDVFTEYHVFKLTESGSLWSPTIPFTQEQISKVPNAYEQISRINAMLSVTVLPTIFSSLMSIPGEVVFNIILPLLFTLVPVSLYQAYKRFGNSVAFLSAFYFMIFPRFWHLISETRQMIAELFFALSIMLILNEDMEPRKKQVLLIIFGASMVVSHYSITFIFMSYIAFWALSSFFAEKLKLKGRLVAFRSVTVSITFVTLFFAMVLFWYTFVNIAPLSTLIRSINEVAKSNIADFFSLETRGTMISQAIAPNFTELSFLQIADYVVNKIPYLFILIGFVRFLYESREEGFKAKYTLMMVPSFLIFLMVILIPNFANIFLADRFYQVALILLAPVCILGGETLSRLILDPKSYRRPKEQYIKLLSLLLIAVFVFKIGFIYEATGDYPKDTSMSFTRMRTSEDFEVKLRLYADYVLDQEISGAKWLSETLDNDSIVYGDTVVMQKITRAYSGLFTYPLERNSSLTDAYVYLRFINIEARQLGMFFRNIDFNNTNKIYSSSYSEIYYGPPRG
jgi:uncharacterized membrane protein